MTMDKVFVKVKDPARFRAALSAGASLRSLAEQTGITYSYIGAMAHGRRKRVRLDYALKLSKALGVKPAELFEVEGLRVMRRAGLA